MKNNIIITVIIVVVLGVGSYAAYLYFSNQNNISVQATAAPNQVSEGETSTISWSSLGATGCYLSSPSEQRNEIGISGSATGKIYSKSLPARITCYDARGNTASTDLNLTIKQGPLSVKATAEPNQVAQGETSTISWSSVGAAGCYLSSPSEQRNEIGTSGSSKGPIYGKGLPAKITCYDASNNSVSTNLDLSVIK